MHSFSYRNGTLHCEGVDLEALASEHGTPLYVYSQATILDHYRRLDTAMSGLDCRICYATKANSNLAVLDLLAREGAGFDIVSGGELFRVERAGGDPGLCTFAGVGKTRAEIEYALDRGIYSFNAESEAEVRFIDQVAGDQGTTAPVALRVNPNVDAKTHKYISTGKSENKFGIDFEVIREAYQRASELQYGKARELEQRLAELEEQLREIKSSGSVLINTSRGAVIDEAALIQRLQRNDIVAALDVFHEEPLPADHPLRGMENVILSPHIGWITDDNYENVVTACIRNIEGFLEVPES
jgi:hypothetical protein